MDKKLTIYHLSSLNLWNIGKNKGRLSTYLPLKKFSKKGHRVIFLSNNKNQVFGNVDGIEVKRVYAPTNLNIKKLSLITKLMFMPISILSYLIVGLWLARSDKPDVIYTHTSDTSIQAYLLSKILNAKYVVRLYGVALNTNSSFIQKLLRLDLIFALKSNADLYILTNDGTSADKLAKYYNVPDTKIEFLKNGIDKTWANSTYNLEIKKDLASKGEKIILTVSRLVGWKQVDLIIKALPKLMTFNNKIKLIIVGDGSDKVRLNKLVIEKKLHKNVVFTGSVEQRLIAEYMHSSDLFISMNALSSMSNPVYEAMICGLPVLALNRGNTEELIKHNYNGFLIEPEDIDNLPNVISNLLDDNEKLKKIGKEAQFYIDSHWPSWEERVNYEVNIIESLFNK